MGQINKERLVLILVDEVYDFLGVAGGEHWLVDGRLDHSFVPQEGQRHFFSIHVV